MCKILLVAVLSATLLLAGCSKHNTIKTPPPAASNEPAKPGALEQGGVQEGKSVEGQTLDQAALNQRIVYFDFDKSDIRPEFRDLISAHARNLVAHLSLKVRLEGHTDERGSREYNIGLGERRAQAVRRALMLEGVSDSQITTVSYGEERPAVLGHDEAAWSKNRRVEVVYGN
jgi:peptidoglycan-associated lipoprotein